MNKTIYSVILGLIVCTFSVSTMDASERTSVAIIMTTCEITGFEEPSDPELPSNPHRKLIKPLGCLIDCEGGIEFDCEEQPEILLYEILDMNGIQLGVFGSEDDFISYFFTLTGTYNLRFTSDECVYTGTVTL